MSGALMSSDTTTVKCPDCGGMREVTNRQYRRILREGADSRCSVCRSMIRPVVISPSHRNFWLNTYTTEWIVETAAMIWGDK
jgi:hypothetical protein